MALLGVFIGWFQAAFLRKWLRKAGLVSWWRVSGIVGGLPVFAGIFYFFLVFFHVPSTLPPTFIKPSPLWKEIEGFLSGVVNVGGTIGFYVGLIQWLILRKRVPRAGWWVLANMVGWPLGLGVVWLLNWAIPTVLQKVVPIEVGVLVGTITGLLMGGLVLGLITGIVLTWLLKEIPPLPGSRNSLPPP